MVDLWNYQLSPRLWFNFDIARPVIIRIPFRPVPVLTAVALVIAVWVML